jgi:hypothetical protein
VTELSPEAVMELLRADPDTGVLYWRVDRRGRARAGDRAGSAGLAGRIQVCINGKNYAASRLVWLLTHGDWPDKCIDHINRIPSDNRPQNLRLATTAENAQNLGMHPRNTTGYPGVTFAVWKYQASITTGGKYRYLGRFDTAEAAAEAYKVAKADFHKFHPHAPSSK